MDRTLKASEILEVKEDVLKEFSSFDSFNGNTIDGVLCRQSDYRYGSIVVFAVNGIETEPQVVYGTPKLEYPFDRNGTFHWPPINEVLLWDKLDGTNILAWSYKDSNGKEFLTYKTRLGPTLTETAYGSFLSMWMEMLERHSWIADAISSNPDYNLSFELYGSRNPITIKYGFPLDTKLLFGVRKTDHAVKPPTQLKNVSKYNSPVSVETSPDDVSNLTELYNNMREGMSKHNQGELLFEGMVLYAHTGGPSWKMFKLKPGEIEKIHWAAGGVIPKRDLWNTAINSLENSEPDMDYFIELLEEEYTLKMITKSRPRINNVFRDAVNHVQVAKSINEVWQKAKEQGFDVTVDKNGTLRWMSQFFPKSQMQKVGGIVLKQAGLL